MKKNLLLVLNSLLLIAVIILFVLVLGNKTSDKRNVNFSKNDSVGNTTLPIAYINTDSLLLNYEFAQESNEKLMKKQENLRLTLNTKAKKLQREIEDFQRKLNAQAFLSRERAEKAQKEILKKQKKLQETEARLTQKLITQQQEISEQLRDTINLFLREYNKDGRYEMILNNSVATDNVLYAKDIYDITDEVVKELNKRYRKK